MDIELDIDVTGGERTGDALLDGLEHGLEDSGEWMLEEGVDTAKNAVQGADRVWRKSVRDGFYSEENPMSRSYHWQGFIKNDVPHADIVDRGLAPAGEIRNANPSVQDILPWVDDNIGSSLPNATASSYNPGNWDPDLQKAAAEYGASTVITAFAVKEKIDTEGYPGIRFTDTTEAYLEQVGPPVIKAKIEAAMRRELRTV